jgi:hypothetical protein
MKTHSPLSTIPADVVRKVIERIKFGGTDECWPINENEKYYGTVLLNGVSFAAHRVVYRIFTGIDPMDAIVCHRCDNKPCVNPNHVYLGTNKTNADDRERRHPRRGIKPNASKPPLHPDFAIAAEREGQ